MGWALVRGRARFVSVVSFAIEAVALGGLIPAGTELDTFGGTALLSVIGLEFADHRLLGLPVPFARRYAQVALRFYVRRRAGGAERRGVVFVSEMLPVGSLVSLGHLLYGEAYQRLPVSARVRPPDAQKQQPGRAVYRWLIDDQVHRLAADFAGEPRLPAPGSAEEFVLDRPWAYVAHHPDLTREYRIDHPPWRIWPAAEARLSPGVPPVFGQRFRRALSSRPVSVLVAEGSRLAVHRPVTISPGPSAAPVSPRAPRSSGA
jgi:uncharacterized protein YqjF (DUF2071 family)